MAEGLWGVYVGVGIHSVRVAGSKLWFESHQVIAWVVPETDYSTCGLVARWSQQKAEGTQTPDPDGT